jgi:hypothetical protein
MQTMEAPSTRDPRLEETGRKRWVVGLIVVAAVLVSILVLGLVYRRFLLSGLDIIAEGTGSRTSALAVLALLMVALALLAVWLSFPFFVYFGLRDLRRRTARLEEATALCARHLARPRTDPQETLPSRPAEQPAPGPPSAGPNPS